MAKATRRRRPYRNRDAMAQLQAEVVALARRGAAPDHIAAQLDVGRDWVMSVLFRYRVDPDARAQIDTALGAA